MFTIDIRYIYKIFWRTVFCMEVFGVTFAGHREIDDFREIEAKL